MSPGGHQSETALPLGRGTSRGHHREMPADRAMSPHRSHAERIAPKHFQGHSELSLADPVRVLRFIYTTIGKLCQF